MTPYKRGDVWCGSFTYRGERFWYGSHPTRKEAKAAEARKRHEVEDLSPETFEGWAKQWLRDYARPSENSQKTYRYATNRLVKEFGSRRLSSIDRMEVRAVAQRLPRYQLKMARVMLNDAIDAGLIRDNPFARLRLEQSRGRKDLEALTEEEIIALADAAPGAYDDAYGLVMRAWVLLAGFTALRPAETGALEWPDIKGDELTVQGTKTKTARRKVPLLPHVLQGLREMPRWFDSPRIFTSVRGHPLTRGILQRNFEKVRVAYGRPDLVPYALRHACATNWMLRGLEPWVIARLMGHNDHGKLVVELYGHPQEKDALARVRAAYGQNVVEIAARRQQAASEGA